MPSIEQLVLRKHGVDGTHRGISDWYPEAEKAIRAAVEKGPEHEWTTGWYACKHEILSGQVSQQDGKIACLASVSDDFDTVGKGKVEATRHEGGVEAVIGQIVAQLEEALGIAEANQKDNRLYVGFVIFYAGKCLDYIILPYGDGSLMEHPPGDNYHEWGYQGEKDDIPEPTFGMLMDFARGWTWDSPPAILRIGDYIIKPWEVDISIDDPLTAVVD